MQTQARAAVDDAAKQTKLVAKLKQQVASLTASASSSSSASSASASSSAAGGSAVERELQVYKSLVNCGVCKDTRKEVCLFIFVPASMNCVFCLCLVAKGFSALC